MHYSARLIAIGLLFTFYSANAQQVELPRFPTQEERLLSLTIKPTPIGITSPPSGPVRSMAEWEELQALVITWNGHNNILTEIVRAAKEECKVVICCENPNVVAQAKNKLTSSGVDFSTNVDFVVAPNNSVWVRDYGPNSVYSNDVDSLYFVDWIYNRPSRPKDDTIATTLAPHFNVPLYSTSKAPSDLVNTGGNFMSDGLGTAFSSELILEENEPGNPYNVTVKTEGQIDQILSDFMGIDRYIKMTPLPYDLIHHIDMHMKLLDEERLLVGQYPPGIADGPQIEANIQYVLSNFKSAFGTPFKVIRIPMPPEGTQYPNAGGDYRTYANAVFVNKTVIVPFYQQQYDTTAQRIWEEAMPGYKIVGINCNSIIPLSGAIHCITKEVGVADPLHIVHQPLECQDNSQTPFGYGIRATIQHKSGISGARIYYAAEPGGPWQFTEMIQDPNSPKEWLGAIPSHAAGTNVHYYLEAEAVSGKTITRPLTAPEGWWKFCITQTSETKDIQAVLQAIYPNPASAITVVPVSATHKVQGRIAVYNTYGQEILTLFAGEIPAGTSNYFLDAGILPSGAYWVKCQAGTQITTQKLMIR